MADNVERIVSVKLHPNVNGVEDTSITLLPETRPQTYRDIVSTLNEGVADEGQVLTADGNGSSAWRTIRISQVENLATKLAELDAEDLTLHGDLEDEFNRATAAEDYLDRKLDQEISDRQEAVSAVSNDLLAESNRAQAKEDELEIAIGSEASQRADADVELESLIGNVSDSLSAAIEEEAGIREDADSHLGELLAAEINRSQAMDEAFTQALSDEANTARSAEEALGSRIDSVVSDFENTVAELTGLISNESNRASSAEEALGERIDVLNNTAASLEDQIQVEAGERQAADEALESLIGNISSELEAEAQRAVEVEGNLSDRIGAIEADYLISTDKAELEAAIEAEVNRASHWEDVLAEQISAEENRAIAAEALKAAKTEAVGSFDLSINSSTYVVTLQAKDVNGTDLGDPETIDLPLESVVVDGSYDAENKKIILELESGSTIDIPVGDLINGLQSEITNENMLSSDLVDDTNKVHKFVSAAEKETWNAKQDAIADLTDIRAGAAAGATAVQPGDLANTASELSDAIVAEAGRAEGVEGNLSSRIGAIEADYLVSADKAELQDAIDDEINRAVAAEELLQAQLDSDIEVVTFQDQEPLTEAQIEKAKAGKLAIYYNGKFYIESYQNEAIINFSHYTSGHTISASQNVNDGVTITEYKIILVISTGLLQNSGASPDDAVGDYANNFFNASTDPTESGKKLVREMNLYKVNTVVAGKQDTIEDLEDIRAGAALGNTSVQPDDIADLLDKATEDDIDNLFPEDVSTFTDITTLNSDPEVTKVNVCLTEDISAGDSDLTFRKDAHIDLDGHTLSFDDWGVEIRNGKTLTVEGGTITSVEAPFYAREAATLVINDGNYSSTNNYVIGTNGTSGKGDNTITVNGGTFNSSMSAASQEKGYIACGVYVANNDTVEIKAGTFNVVDGVGILARSGNTIVHDGVVVNVTGAGKSGYVGDSKILVPAGNAYVLDLVADYPGGSPSITVNGITVNAENYTETAAEAGVVVITA